MTERRSPEEMTQRAPWPAALEDLVARLRYHPGWTFDLESYDRGQGSEGLTLTITVRGVNSRKPDDTIAVSHLFPVPPAAYNKRSWQHWLFERVMDVHRHEAGEFFQIVRLPSYLGQDGEQHELVRRPYAPLHAPGNDPYMTVEATVAEEHTTNTGHVHDH